MNPQSIWNYLKGKKTYTALAGGAIVIALNAAGFLPDAMAAQLNLDPHNFAADEYKLLVGAFFRHGIG